MLATSPMPGAEEWAIHDYEGFGPLRLGEHEDVAVVAAVAAGIQQHGTAFAHWAAMHDRLEAASTEDFEDVYLGYWESLSAFAQELWDDMGYESAIDTALPESLRPYVKFDAEAYGRDLELGGDIVVSEGDGGVHVFSGAAR
jgi:antirestriction protein